jgi:hypothetical protein
MIYLEAMTLVVALVGRLVVALVGRPSVSTPALILII